jgi:hypothetical protein
MAALDVREFPPINEGYVRFIASDSSVHDVPERWLSQAYTIDPDLRLVPGPDADVASAASNLLLIVEGHRNQGGTKSD